MKLNRCKPDNGSGFRKCVYDIHTVPPKNYLAKDFCSVAAKGIHKENCKYHNKEINNHAIKLTQIIKDYLHELDYYTYEGGIPVPIIPCPYKLDKSKCTLCWDFIKLPKPTNKCPCNVLGTNVALLCTIKAIQEIYPDEEFDTHLI